MAEKEYNPFLSFEGAERGGYNNLLERDGEESGLKTHRKFISVDSIPDPSDIFNTFDSIAGRVFKEKQRQRKGGIGNGA